MRHRKVRIVVVNVDSACRLGGFFGQLVGVVLSLRRHDDFAPSVADRRRIVGASTSFRRI